MNTWKHRQYDQRSWQSFRVFGKAGQHRPLTRLLHSLLALIVFCTGCKSPRSTAPLVSSADARHYQAATAQVEYAELEQPVASDALLNARPISLTSNLAEIQYWNLNLQDVMHLALQHSKVMRSLGTTVLRAPGTVGSSFDPAIRETDPRFGVQAALSAFDASFAASVFHQKNDRALNNQFFGGGTRILEQDATVMQAQIAKQSASGTQYILRNITDYDYNNAPGNAFPGAWTTMMEAEVRQPLLRGYGLEYWQTVGASETPGVYTGMLIARTHTDISQSEFEISVRDFMAQIENSYWDLYYAYQDLDAKKATRDAALELWRRLDALNQLGRAGGEADKEAQAREQYFRFEEDVQNALNGRPEDGTKTYNGTTAGSFKGNGGVLNAERRLRYLIGLPINDEKLIRPCDEPLAAPIEFHWETVLSESLQYRPELRRQKWVVKQKELELVASQKLMLPELDVVGLYRWRGFGEDLSRPGAGSSGPRFDNAWGDLMSGDFQEWQLGVELEIPIGNRRAHAGVRNAEFQLARSRQVLKDQERLIVHDLSNSISEVDRAWNVLKTVRHRLQAAEDQVNAMIAAFEADQAPVNLVLEAQRRYASARSAYYSAVLDYNFAVRNMHVEKGTYLDYCGVHVSEGPWSQAATQHATEMQRRTHIPKRQPWFLNPPQVISHGVAPNVEQQLILDDHPLQGYLAGESHAEQNASPKPSHSGSPETAPDPIALPLPGSLPESQPYFQPDLLRTPQSSVPGQQPETAARPATGRVILNAPPAAR